MPQSGMGDGYHLHSPTGRLIVAVRHHRYLQPLCAGLTVYSFEIRYYTKPKSVAVNPRKATTLQ